MENSAEAIFSEDLASTDEGVASVIETEGVAQSSFNNGFDDSTFVASCYAGELDPAGSVYGLGTGYVDPYYGGDCFYGGDYCGGGYGYGGYYPDWGYGFCDGYGCYGGGYFDPYYGYGGGYGFNPYFGYGGYPCWGGFGDYCCPYFGGPSSYCMYGQDPWLCRQPQIIIIKDDDCDSDDDDCEKSQYPARREWDFMPTCAYPHGGY